MDIEDIRQLIATGENRHLELKKSTGELKDGMRTACAFLNGEGGWLIFGITPTSLKIIGQDITDNTQREIANALSGLEPAPVLVTQYINIPDKPNKQVIAMYFEAFVWGQEPYTYRGCPYYKVETTTKEMPRSMFEERLRVHKPKLYSWERQQADRVELRDLNEERVRGVLRLGFEHDRVPSTALTEPIERVLDKLELLTNGKPNNAAVALFGAKFREYPQMRLRMARFKGKDKNEFIDNQRVDGNFFDLLDAGMAFFLKHLSISGKIVGFKRIETLEVPSEALREALTNALCHRQFEQYNLTPSIAVFDDRIEIENPGILPPQLTVENIKQPHNSYPYNPIIANVLFKTTFFENWGGGIMRILDVCKKQNAPEPVWNINGGFVCITFKRPNLPPKLPPKLPPNLPPKLISSKERVENLIMAMSDDFMTVSSMLEVCDLKNRKEFRTSYIIPALEENAIERRYPDNPNHPRQQYRLTDAAKRWKAMIMRKKK